MTRGVLTFEEGTLEAIASDVSEWLDNNNDKNIIHMNTFWTSWPTYKCIIIWETTN